MIYYKSLNLFKYIHLNLFIKKKLFLEVEVTVGSISCGELFWEEW